MALTRERIAVAFTFVNDGIEWHGGLNYFRSLFLALESATDCRIDPVAFVGKGTDVSRLAFPPNVRMVSDAVLDRKSPRWVLNKLGSMAFGVTWLRNHAIRRHGIDIVSHSEPTGQQSLKNIAWIPDFQHLHLPQLFSSTELQSRTKLYKRMIARSDLVVVSSEAARRDLVLFAPSYAAKARVLRFCAVRPEVDEHGPLDLALAYGIQNPYFYIPNQAWAHKNHLTAIRALALVLGSNPEASVVCSGLLADYRNPDHHGLLRGEISRLGLENRFRMLGVVPYPHIAQLMLQSLAVINPSQSEGWSTTVEEGKALGVPLILSGIDVHREQCQRNEAVFFDTLDEVSLAECMLAKLAVPRLPTTDADRAAYKARHHQRSNVFASEFEAIVRELHASRPH